jgi:hypothetical protein
VCKEDRRFRQELETNRWARYNNRFNNSGFRINDSQVSIAGTQEEEDRLRNRFKQQEH